VPSNLIEIFRNANYLLTNLLIDYLDQMLDSIDRSKVFFVNPMIYKEKEIYFIVNQRKKSNYSIWKIRFDRRFKLWQKIEQVQDLEIDPAIEDALKKKIREINDPKLESIDGNKNVIFIVTNKEVDREMAVRATVGSVSFTRLIGLDYPFNPNILDELYDIIVRERVLPFTIKS